ncbi:glycosyltransferase [Alteromonas sp. Mac1]|uniref:glycosyltransferase n=1 Tax=Alteromonas sp. Mac1 TaxID=1777491 RepID=UPI000770158A|nr:glycosyltransferase [Alteromonas sp. Mac1]AMJ88203.1 glycosyl transferase family 2 [Alteromonas sp. Mac1]AMJ92060.1 glycosyl transferase family 2 [Alteromonas sp. Mac2]
MTNKEYFDPEWYLKQYPDVAAAGVDPKIHFDKYGREEGRLPCYMPSLAWEKKLWANVSKSNAVLTLLVSASESESINGIYATKVLAEYYLYSEQYTLAKKFSDRLFNSTSLAEALFSRDELYLLSFSALYKAGCKDGAAKVAYSSSWENSSKLLAQSMLAVSSKKLEPVNYLFRKNRLAEISSVGELVLLDSLISEGGCLSVINRFKALISNLKVSIIVPVFNAKETLLTCLNSLLNQTWKNLEIIVVDDGSTDGSAAELMRICGVAECIKIIQNKKNLGAYASRNIGMCAATGEFLTVMDADDWAHPQKIEKQVSPLLFNRALKGTISHWVRCSKSLEFSRLRAGAALVHRNVSSLCLRREVVDTLGGWDEVKVNADTEFYERCLKKYGGAAIKEILPEVPLSFGRTHTSSLTQSSDTHLVTQYGGVRKQYMDFARIWHKTADKLIAPSQLKPRPFPVPPIMLKEKDELNAEQFTRWSEALNETWYLSLYPDVELLGKGLHEHFWETGEAEGRYPSPLFCPDAYRYKFDLSLEESPTCHALISDWDFNTPVEIKGEASGVKQNALKIALFGHSVSKQIFGAERSLLDMTIALSGSANVTVFLPACTNSQYIEELLKYSVSIVFIPLPWVKKSRAIFSDIVTFLTQRFVSGEFDCVYVNTIMLLEPFLAAKAAKVLSVVHVRELVEFDVDLTNILEETPEQSRSRVCESADFYIANSKETYKWLAAHQQTKVIYNCIDAGNQTDTAQNPHVLKVCMLSSNVKKKGVYDFFEIASLCKDSPKIQFTLYGPSTIDTKKASQKFGCSNIEIAGYVDEPLEALKKHDVVLALSNFKESFGRTVAEAMSLGKVVVAYNWGALGELIDEESGFLVEYKDINTIVATLQLLSKNIKLRERIQYSAALRAKALLSRDAYNYRLSNHIIHLIKKHNDNRSCVISQESSN